MPYIETPNCIHVYNNALHIKPAVNRSIFFKTIVLPTKLPGRISLAIEALTQL